MADSDPQPTAEDRERARAWYARTMGYITKADDLKIESLAREFARVREEARRP